MGVIGTVPLGPSTVTFLDLMFTLTIRESMLAIARVRKRVVISRDSRIPFGSLLSHFARSASNIEPNPYKQKAAAASFQSRTSLGNHQGLFAVNVPHLDELSSGGGRIEGGVDLGNCVLGGSSDCSNLLG